MSNNFLKHIKEEIIGPLTVCINESLRTGIFPDFLKKAKVIPVLKKGDIEDPSSYRPISIVPVFSKLYKTLIKIQLCDYFEQNNIFAVKQHAFREGFSTTTAICNLVEHILRAFEERSALLSVFLDLTKAFDCVKLETLIEKLQYLGICNHELKLIVSYLSNREQCIVLHG